MAKRKAKRLPPATTPIRLQTAETRTTPQAIESKQSLRPFKRRPALARRKHGHDLEPPSYLASSPLLDRFYALPAELRERVFAILLVQPTKWDIPHLRTCPLRTTADQRITFRPRLDVLRNCCAECSLQHFSRSLPRHWPIYPIWEDPWRSQWAPEQLNPYLCTKCYDEKHRPDRPVVHPEALPCLCARRRNLQILLVCKRWYEEASRVFWRRNTFAFEDARSFLDFLGHIRPETALEIRHISLMAWLPDAHAAHDSTADPGDWDPTPYRKVWSALRRLASLSTLELDSLFLTRIESLRAIRKLGMRQLRKCTFAQRLPDAFFTRPEPYLFPGLARRHIVCRTLAEEVAREIKGERRRWAKGGKKVVGLYMQWECEDRKWRVFAKEKVPVAGTDVAELDWWTINRWS